MSLATSARKAVDFRHLAQARDCRMKSRKNVTYLWALPLTVKRTTCHDTISRELSRRFSVVSLSRSLLEGLLLSVREIYNGKNRRVLFTIAGSKDENFSHLW